METKWDLNVIKDPFNNPIDVEDIGKIYIPKFFSKDKRIWHWFGSVGHALMLYNYARASWFGSQWGLHSDLTLFGVI